MIFKTLCNIALSISCTLLLAACPEPQPSATASNGKFKVEKAAAQANAPVRETLVYASNNGSTTYTATDTPGVFDRSTGGELRLDAAGRIIQVGRRSFRGDCGSGLLPDASAPLVVGQAWSCFYRISTGGSKTQNCAITSRGPYTVESGTFETIEVKCRFDDGSGGDTLRFTDGSGVMPARVRIYRSFWRAGGNRGESELVRWVVPVG